MKFLLVVDPKGGIVRASHVPFFGVDGVLHSCLGFRGRMSRMSGAKSDEAGRGARPYVPPVVGRERTFD
jgi:hypothetical protein